MATLLDLSRQMEKLNRELPRKVNDVAKRVAKVVLKEIVEKTQVDTSQAISNYQIGFGEGNFTNLPPHVPGKFGSSRAASAAETIGVGNINIDGKLPGVPLHISNGLDYIDKINEIAGFENAAIAAGHQALAKEKI